MLRHRVSRVALAAIVGAALTAPAASAGGPQVEVVARGLDNPRGVAVVGDGLVLVAEAGRGGAGPCIPSLEGGDACLGPSGAVTAAWRTHHGDRYRQRRIVRGLPSIAVAGGSSATGAHDVALGRRGTLLVPLGLGNNPALRADLGSDGALLGRLVAVRPHGRPRSIADLAAFEAVHDPDRGLPGTQVDTNPYGVVAGRRGAVVADAGGNDLLRIRRRGAIEPLAVFPPELVDGPQPGTRIPMQFVPTAVVRGPDGALYVGQLTGVPFPLGGSRVWRIARGGPPVPVASGFTSVIDIAFDRAGRLHVLEMFAKGVFSGDPTGRLVRVERDGRQVEIPAGLTTPGGLAIDDDGSIFVTNKATAAGAGELLRIRP